MPTLLLWALLSALAVRLQDAPAQDLIERLGSDQVETREAALKGLRQKGEDARPALDRAANHADPQVRAAVRALLSQLNLRAAAEKRRQIARKAALQLKPAFDAIEAGGKEVANGDGRRFELDPLASLQGLQSDFNSVWTINAPSADADLAIRNCGIQPGTALVGNMPAEVVPFEDLNLTCWSLPEGGGGLVRMNAGWIFFRRLECARWRHQINRPQGTNGFAEYRLRLLIVHVRRIGDLVFEAPPPEEAAPSSLSHDAEKMVYMMDQKISSAKRCRVQVEGRLGEKTFRASVLLCPAKDPHPFYARSFLNYEESGGTGSQGRLQWIWGGGVPCFTAEGIPNPRRPRCLDLGSNARALLTHLGIHEGITGGHLSYREREGMMNTLEGQLLPDRFELKGEETIGTRSAVLIHYRLGMRHSTKTWRVQLWMDRERSTPIRRIYTAEQGETITEEYPRFELDEEMDESPLAGTLVQSESERTASLLDFTSALIEVYRLYNDDKYPDRLDALVSGRKGTWIEKYLKDHAPLQDAWGRPFQYRMPGTKGRRYDLGSLGADGREGGTGADGDLWLDD
jgi:general secretion pathway protein G